jgi:hypothetical protein
LIRRWLKVGVVEDGAVHLNEEGTPKGGSISVLLSIDRAGGMPEPHVTTFQIHNKYNR